MFNLDSIRFVVSRVMTTQLRSLHYVLCFAGIGIALYSMHVESMLVEIPGYTPACDISSWAMSCSKVFTSKYAKPLSNWDIVSRGSSFDFSLPQFAIVYFILMLILPDVRDKKPSLVVGFRTLSYMAIAFNLYLAYILKFVLGEVCVVCVSNYFVNSGLWLTVSRISREETLTHVRRGRKQD